MTMGLGSYFLQVSICRIQQFALHLRVFTIVHIRNLNDIDELLIIVELLKIVVFLFMMAVEFYSI